MMSGTIEKTSRRNPMLRVGGIVMVVAGLAYGIPSCYFYFASPQIAARAQVDVLQGRTDSARSRVSRVLWFHPQNPHAQLTLGKIELADQATSEAIACFRSIPPDSDLHPLASFQLAKTYALDGQLTAAEMELQQYIGQYEPTQAVWDLYFRLLYLQTRTRDIITLFERKLAATLESLSDARFLLKVEFVPQEPLETLAALEDIHERHPDDINAQVALAVALMRANDQGRAEQLLRLALQRKPDHHRARLVLAQFYANRQQFSLAEEVLWLLGGYPDSESTAGIAQDDRFWSLSSRLAEQNAETAVALQYVDRALQIRENDKLYLSQRAQILRQLGNKEEATIASKKSIEAGQFEQDLFLLARQFEDRPISPVDCTTIAHLYRKLSRLPRAELWDRLAVGMNQTQGGISAPDGIRIQ